MSLDLSIKFSNAVNFRTLSSGAAENLKRILNIDVLFRIKEKSRYSFHLLDDNFLIPLDKKAYIFFVKDFEEDIVEGTSVFVPRIDGFEDADQEGWWFIFTIRSAIDSSMKFALFFALSITFAELQQQLIVEDSLLIFGKEKIDYDELLNVIKNSQTNLEMNDALNNFYHKLENLHLV